MLVRGRSFSSDIKDMQNRALAPEEISVSVLAIYKMASCQLPPIRPESAALFGGWDRRFQLGDLLFDEVGAWSGRHIGQAVAQMLERAGIVPFPSQNNRQELFGVRRRVQRVHRERLGGAGFGNIRLA